MLVQNTLNNNEFNDQLKLIEDYYYSFVLGLVKGDLYFFEVYDENKTRKNLKLMFLGVEFKAHGSFYKFLCFNTGHFLYFPKETKVVELSKSCLYEINGDKNSSIRKMIYRIDKIFKFSYDASK